MTTYLQSSLLSPFSVKARVLCRAFGVDAVYTPENGSMLTAARIQLRLEAAKRGYGTCLHRDPSPLDEFPLVPWLFTPKGYLCDSTEIGLFLERESGLPLTPQEPLRAFEVRLVEECVDEVLLYALHHMRWVASARQNRAMEVLAEEISGSLGRSAGEVFVRQFGPRQVRRLAYLFSIAPTSSPEFNDLPPSLRPPSRDGFPPTHELLELLWHRLLQALEQVLADGREYLFGDGLTLADAALIGNLGSTLEVDPEASELMRASAPKTSAWVMARMSRAALNRDLSRHAEPLVRWAAECALPLLAQNATAFEHFRKQPRGLRDEQAFDRGERLYRGELMGFEFRTVVKDFQVPTYRELRDLFDELGSDDQSYLSGLGVEFHHH